MTTLEEQAKWHDERAIEEDNNARDLGDCDDGAMTSKLRKMLRDRHEHDAARHRASAAVCRALQHKSTLGSHHTAESWLEEDVRLCVIVTEKLSDIPHA